MLVFETDDAERRAADVPGDTSSTATIAVGGTRSGDIGPGPTDQDWYGVTLTAGLTYAITLDGAGASPLQDPFLSVFDHAGTLVTSNDDGGDGLNSALTFTVATTGQYFASAGAYGTSGANIGQYVLRLSETAPPPPGTRCARSTGERRSPTPASSTSISPRRARASAARSRPAGASTKKPRRCWPSSSSRTSPT